MGMNAFCRLLRPAFGIALASAIGALPAWADTTLVVGKAAADADAIMAVDVGDQAGLFKKRGLDLKIVLFEGGGKMIQALAAGSVDIGDAAGIQMAFIVKGAPMMAVCENTSTLPSGRAVACGWLPSRATPRFSGLPHRPPWPRATCHRLPPRPFQNT